MNVKVEAKLREIGKKSVLKKYRNENLIPGIIYGEGNEGLKILIPKIQFHKDYKKTVGEVAFFNIHVDGKEFNTFIKEKQIHPVTREFVHIDFMEFHKGKEITLKIPFRYIGEAEGIQEGGQLEILHREIEISCLPIDIPEEISIDVSELKIGDSIHFGDITIPKNIETNMSEITTLVAVRAPRKEEVIEVEEEEIEGEEGEEAAEEGEETKEKATEEPSDQAPEK